MALHNSSGMPRPESSLWRLLVYVGQKKYKWPVWPETMKSKQNINCLLFERCMYI